jgi:5'-nucleotidase
VNVTVLGLNDFHGNLLPTSFTLSDRTTRIQAGGVEAIGGLLDTVRKENPNTVLVVAATSSGRAR